MKRIIYHARVCRNCYRIAGVRGVLLYLEVCWKTKNATW
jgi:hypothetical protein